MIKYNIQYTKYNIQYTKYNIQYSKYNIQYNKYILDFSYIFEISPTIVPTILVTLWSSSTFDL